jgi:2-polyprenyl-3-methyl-5-hydroxy-6-metoxy-1,4-benzoquinol methylase
MAPNLDQIREHALLTRLVAIAETHDADQWQAQAQVRMYRLAARMRREGATTCVVYGAGEVGQLLFEAARDVGLEVVAFIESDQRRVGQRVRGVPVVGPSAALDQGAAVIALGTLSSQDAMRRALSSSDPAGRGSIFADPDPPPARRTTLSALCDACRVTVARGRRLADVEWVLANAEERMDAFLPIFRESRRTFHLMRYRFAAARARGARVLDCASGTGYGAHILAREGGALSVIGADVSGQAADYARRYFGAPGVVFVVREAARLNDLAGPFDLVTSFETIEHVPDDLAMLEAVTKVLAPLGTFIVSTPNAWPFENHPFHVRSYDAVSFRALLSRFFSHVELYGQWSADLGVEPAIASLDPVPAVPAECLVAVCDGPRIA